MHRESPVLLSESPIHAQGVRVGLVVSAYHSEITSALEAGAVESYEMLGGVASDLVRVSVPGAFELVAVASALAERSNLHAVVALGCIVRGETRHDRWLAQAVAHGLASIAARLGKPVAFGVLTVDRLKQARDRAGGAKGNKGREAMIAAVGAAQAIATVRR